MISITKVNNCIQKALAKNKANGLEEPDYTVLLAISLPEIIKDFSSNPAKIKAGSCFIHQSPLACFSSTHKNKSCELGDLLVLVRKTTVDGIRYNASFVQMKRSSGKSPLRIMKNNELKQLFLYEHWPCFLIKQFGKQYDIFPKTSSQGAWYCIIQNNSDNSSVQYYMSEPMSSMHYSSRHTFGKFIVNLVEWKTGRCISNSLSKDSDEWSKLVWDVVRHCVQSKFNRKKSGFKDASRATGDILKCLLEETAKSEAAPSVFPEDIESDKKRFYLLFIDVDERDQAN